MSLNVSAVPHRFLLADDFLDLGHWYHYGANSREYELRTDVSIGQGNTLWTGDTGTLRLARDTELIPGEPVQVSWWIFRSTPGAGPFYVQLREGGEGVGIGRQPVNLLDQNTELLPVGWSHCTATGTPPESWGAVRISLYANGGSAGGIATLRTIAANEEGPEG